ncbi:hypothetical protein ACHAXH_009482 [Discostella pseudostelligera]
MMSGSLAPLTTVMRKSGSHDELSRLLPPDSSTSASGKQYVTLGGFFSLQHIILSSTFMLGIGFAITLLLLFTNPVYHNNDEGISRNSATTRTSAALLRSSFTYQEERQINVNPTKNIRPGSIFVDTEGNPINAHGGGFLFHNGTYYWYGEIKSGATYLPKQNADWGGTRVDLVGISCYTSTDLLNWEYRGNVLPSSIEIDDLAHDKVVERPKVVYNEKTHKFVMWMHVDSPDYQKANCGIAISDYPDGPFDYISSFRPDDGQMCRDLTVFVDDDKKAYLFTSSEDNAAMHISELTDDYLSTTGTYTRVFIGRYMEAPTVFKRDGKYYFIGSGSTAWEPNAARSAVASSSIWGPWVELGNPCRGDGAYVTFHSQPTYILPVGDKFIFIADRWNGNNLSDSRYVWLPLFFDGWTDQPLLRWHDEWSPSEWPA